MVNVGVMLAVMGVMMLATPLVMIWRETINDDWPENPDRLEEYFLRWIMAQPLQRIAFILDLIRFGFVQITVGLVLAWAQFAPVLR